MDFNNKYKLDHLETYNNNKKYFFRKKINIIKFKDINQSIYKLQITFKNFMNKKYSINKDYKVNINYESIFEEIRVFINFKLYIVLIKIIIKYNIKNKE